MTPIVDDSEMLRAYAETIRLKDAEIERWKVQYEEMLLTMNLPKMENPFEAELKRHKDLHTRAADALAGMDRKWEGDWSALIAELRKAAE